MNDETRAALPAPLTLTTTELHLVGHLLAAEDRRLTRIKLRKGERLSERAMERGIVRSLFERISAELDAREG